VNFAAEKKTPLAVNTQIQMGCIEHS